MGQLMEQGPNVHCGNDAKHAKHSNRTNTFLHAAWCDGEPPLEPFIELAIRIPLEAMFGDDLVSHVPVMRTLAEEGLATLVDYMNDKTAKTTLRVRTGDGLDRVYPVVKSRITGQGKLW